MQYLICNMQISAIPYAMLLHGPASIATDVLVPNP